MLELLKAAAKIAEPKEINAYPDDKLTFTLEYETVPDLAAERQRISELLEGTGFDLFSFSEEDPVFLQLLFADVDIQQSSDYLFSEAEQLREALGLVSVTPEILPPYTDSVTTAPAPESLGAVVDFFCQSQAQEPADPHWATKLIKADIAQSKYSVSGNGVRIGQPDTGVAQHLEIEDGIDKGSGFNFVDGIQDPTDPLSSGMSSPGHGTATASVVASRPDHVIAGSAPGVELVPIRAVNSVIIRSGSAVARAIDHARNQNCRIVTMSLGGPIASPTLRRAIQRAVDANMIVLAAAGNCVKIVVYPAWDANVIAIAGVDENKKRWRGSSRGSAVDVCAPAENVHVARRRPEQEPTNEDLAEIDRRGQGTSYAVALTAGVAALWVERFGESNLIAEADRRSINLQELFRSALRETANPTEDWDEDKMGTGIIDAEALLDMEISDIPEPSNVEGADPSASILGRSFFETPMQSEASFIASDWAMRNEDVGAQLIENALPPEPSPKLAELISTEPTSDFAEPAIIAAPATPPMPLDIALRSLSSGMSGNVESTTDVEPGAALERLRTEGTDSILETAAELLAERADRSEDLVDKSVQAEVLRRAAPVLENISRSSELISNPTKESRAVVEALVKLTGRPAIRAQRDGQEFMNPLLGDWTADLVPRRNKWKPFVKAVGRIDIRSAMGTWKHAGTGFLMADGVVITNRHVIDTFVEPLPTIDGEQKFQPRRRASIIFDPDAKDEKTRYAIKRVISAGKDRIGKFVNLNKLDMALVEIETDNGHESPPPIVNRGTVSLSSEELKKMLIIGYPAKPHRNAGPDADDDQHKFLAFWDRIEEIYGEEYGVKYLSPGFVIDRPGEVAGDPNGWAFTHDATTMAGNSGSAIICLHGNMNFCGLHFGGESLTQNFAHDLQAVRSNGDGVFDKNTLPKAET